MKYYEYESNGHNWEMGADNIAAGGIGDAAYFFPKFFKN
jgi:hypothetical protein